VLQEKQFQRIGGSRILDVNVRVIAASNKDLKKAIEKGDFREELYYRLNVIPIEVPPLRNRAEDIPLLVETFLDECAKQNRSKRKQMTQAALSLLSRYSWPGNVRELKNLIERLGIMVEKDVIDDSDMPQPYNPDSRGDLTSIESQLFLLEDLIDARKAFEIEFIQRKLVQYNNNVSKTAEAIGVKPSYLHKKLKNMP
jgi:two-component system nitrogen regulation response regulator NtrX